VYQSLAARSHWADNFILVLPNFLKTLSLPKQIFGDCVRIMSYPKKRENTIVNLKKIRALNKCIVKTDKAVILSPDKILPGSWAGRRRL
jgi:hypothetical protein